MHLSPDLQLQEAHQVRAQSNNPLYTCISRHSMRPNYLTKLAHVCMPRPLYISWKKKKKKKKKTTTTKQSVNSLFIPPAFMPLRSSIRVFVHSCVRHVRGIYHKFFTELRNSFSSGVYLMNQSSESIHIWIIGILEGRLSFHDSWSQGPCPRVGLEIKI